MEQMTNKTCKQFLASLAGKEAVPGGGGASALVGAIGVALQYGSYKKATLSNKYFSFVREFEGEKVIVAINISEGDPTVRIEEAEGTDLLTGQIRNLNDIYLPPFTGGIYRRIS